MQRRRTLAIPLLLFFILLAIAPVAIAKDKKKNLLPVDVLQARTVLVAIDPNAGIEAEDPMANRNVQQAVEKALLAWGRFDLAIDATTADLIITVRKGNGKIAQPTIGGVPNNNRPVVLDPTDSGGRVGVRQSSGSAGDLSNSQSPSSGPYPQVEIGQSQDTFVVYRGSKDDPRWSPPDSPAVWRYTATNALQVPGVPAVAVFRKLIADSEKQQAATP